MTASTSSNVARNHRPGKKVCHKAKSFLTKKIMTTPINSDFKAKEATTNGIVVPDEKDVVLVKGEWSRHFVGTRHFCLLADHNRPIYACHNTLGRKIIVRSVVEAIRSQEPAGKFLKMDESTGLYYEMKDKDAMRFTRATIVGSNVDKDKSIALNTGETETSQSDNCSDKSKREVSAAPSA